MPSLLPSLVSTRMFTLKLIPACMPWPTLIRGNVPSFSLLSGGFSAAAFFLGPVWMLYRKMWLWAAGVFAFAIAIGYIPGLPHAAGIGLAAAMGAAGRRIYVFHAIAKIGKWRAAGGQPDQLARLGGVSATAGWASGLVLLVLFAVTLYGAMLLSRSPVR